MCGASCCPAIMPMPATTLLEGNAYEPIEDCRDRQLPHRGPRFAVRLDRLAVSARVRLAVGVCRAAPPAAWRPLRPCDRAGLSKRGANTSAIRTCCAWLGLLFGMVHGLIQLIVLLPLLVHCHPRIASEYDGPSDARRLEPPGFPALNFGYRTPLVTLIAHMAYGVILGVGLQPIL